MAKTIDDYDNFINLLSNPENFRVYSIDDSIKTTTNISIKLIAVISGNESNNYELKFINKKREIPIGLRNYTTDNPIYYNSNNLKCITSIHADDYEKNIYNIYHTTTTNLGEYIKYYIINNQEIIYEIKIYVPLIIIMNIINKQNTKIVLIDRTSKNFSETNETNKTQNCSIEIDLLKRISKKLFNTNSKALANIAKLQKDVDREKLKADKLLVAAQAASMKAESFLPESNLEIFKELQTRGTIPSNAGGGGLQNIYNVTVNGALNSEQTSRQIIDILNQSQARGTLGASGLVGAVNF